MLQPDTRHLLTDALRPPEGFHLDTAVATTYSLDLTSLILAPLAMAAHDQIGGSGNATPDPIALLESVRRHAEHTTVFCQAGAIHVPAAYQRIVAFAEDSVVEVLPPQRGKVFHPKIWVLRFADSEGAFRHRFLCLSRNLTMDKSWDTVLQLDENAHGTGADPSPLVDFLRDLPALALRPLPGRRAAQLTDLRRTLRTITFEVPTPFSQAELWPLGTKADRGWPFPDSANDLVAISAFVDSALLHRLPHPREPWLVSRMETFDRLGSAAIPDRFSPFVLQRMAETEDPDAERDQRRTEVRTGLHAKTFIWDVEHTGHVFTGSANATSAAFGGNVEFGVLLSGPKGSCGVPPLLQDTKENPGLKRVLEPYEIPHPDPKVDPVYAAEMQIEDLHARLAAGIITVTVSSDGDEHSLEVGLETPYQAEALKTSIRPLGVKGPKRHLTEPLVWRPVAIQNISPFIVLETTATTESVTVTRACVVKATLVGDPEIRHRSVLRALLANELDLLRYLALLLADPSFDALIATLKDTLIEDGAKPRHRSAARDDLIIFEPLVRAAARRDGSLERVDSLFKEIRDPDGSVPHLSEDFLQLWTVVWRAAQEAPR